MYSFSINFDFFQTLAKNFSLVFFNLVLSFLSLKTSFPAKDIFLIFILSPLSTLTTIFRVFFSVESGIVFKETFVFRNPSFLNLFTM